MRDLAPMSFLLLGGACTVSAPPPADAPDPPAASTGEVREEAAAFDPDCRTLLMNPHGSSGAYFKIM